VRLIWHLVVFNEHLVVFNKRLVLFLEVNSERTLTVFFDVLSIVDFFIVFFLCKYPHIYINKIGGFWWGGGGVWNSAIGKCWELGRAMLNDIILCKKKVECIYWIHQLGLPKALIELLKSVIWFGQKRKLDQWNARIWSWEKRPLGCSKARANLKKRQLALEAQKEFVQI
jgi:hypothetical protein